MAGLPALGRPPDQETRDRLLAVAARLFADRGFKDVTVREICRAGRANVAAVNYHFGDKLGLYREVLRTAIDAMQSTADAARRAGDGFPAEERLRRFVRVFMRRILLEAAPSLTHKLITRELADPTEVLDEIVQRGIRPRIEYLSTLVGDILGAPADDPRVVRAVASIQAQMVFYVPNPVLERFGVRANAIAREVDALADHITAFSLGGIRAIGRRRSARLASTLRK